jgi:hypothetical protein
VERTLSGGFPQLSSCRLSRTGRCAIAYYNGAIGLIPGFATAFLGRGIAYSDKGDNDRAIADFGEVIRRSAVDQVSLGHQIANFKTPLLAMPT